MNHQMITSTSHLLILIVISFEGPIFGPHPPITLEHSSIRPIVDADARLSANLSLSLRRCTSAMPCSIYVADYDAR